MRRTKAVDNFLNFFPVMDTNHAVCFCVKTNIVWCCHQDLLVLPTFKVMNSIINEDIASYKLLSACYNNLIPRQKWKVLE